MIDTETSYKEQILFVISQTKPGNGGVESITLVIENLKTLQPTIVTNIELPVNDRWKKVGAEVILRPSILPLSKKGDKLSPKDLLNEILRWLKNNLYFYSLINQAQFRLVHFNDIQGAFQGIIAAKLAGAKIVFNIRDTKPATEKYGWKWHLVTKLSDKIIVLSREMKQILEEALKISPDSDKVTYIYSSIDFSRFHPVSSEEKQQLRQNLGIDQSTFAIGYVASINAKKNQLGLIEKGASLLKSKIPNSKIYLIGNFQPENDDYAKECKQKVSDLGLQEYVTFSGYSPNIENWYQVLDLVVIVSIREGLARCMIEALACGIPVISFEVSSAKEILEKNKCGFTITSGDYPYLIEKIYGLWQDKLLFNDVVTNSFKTAKSLFSEINIMRYEEIYCKIISN